MKRTFKIRKSHRPNARILDPKKSKHRDKPEPSSRTEEEQMDHDNLRHHNRKTLRDQYGNYPEWMNQKTVKMLAKKSKKAKRLERKKKYQMLCKKGLRKYSKETMETETVGLDEAITKLQKVEVGYPKKAQ